MSTISMVIFSNLLFATYSVYARYTSITQCVYACMCSWYGSSSITSHVIWSSRRPWPKFVRLTWQR